MDKKFIFIGGRERGLFLLKKILSSTESLSGFIVMGDDEHEEQWAPRIIHELEKTNIPYASGKSFKNKQILELYQALNPEIVFVENWRTIIPKEIYQKAEHFLVFHESLLPRYRGFAPLVWPIINRETETGVTLFYIGEGVDSGDIVDQIKIKIEKNDTCNELFHKTYEVYWQLIEKNIKKLKSGNVEKNLQDETQATYACMRTPDDGKINWKDSTKDIYNLIRAAAPPLMPGAFTTYDGEKIIITKAMIPEAQPYYEGRIPGRIVKIQEKSVLILTGDGILQIDAVKKAGTSDELFASEVFNKMKVKLI